jgi:hypothetical protein
MPAPENAATPKVYNDPIVAAAPPRIGRLLRRTVRPFAQFES